MPTKTQTLTIKRTIARPIHEIYQAFTRTPLVRTWLCDAAQVDTSKGGRIFLHWNVGYTVVGQFTANDPNKKIAFTWHGDSDPGPSTIKVTFKEKAGHTTVTLAHTLGTGKVWQPTADGFTSEWPNKLENLQSVMETGEDLRIIRRPMLGIAGFSELTAETAAKLGVPVKQGIRIGGTVEGFGAHAAGLRADDVVVQMGKTKTTKFAHIDSALGQHRAGDTLPVTFYRGPDKKVVPMTLSRRPLPALPATAAELASQLIENDAKDLAALTELFKGTPEEHAAHRPAPEEWSAKEVLAHLLISERGNAEYASEMLVAAERWYDNFDNEINVYPAALIATYPTSAALLEAIRLAQAETHAFCAALTPAALANKNFYWRFCFSLFAGPSHIATHLDQIRAALQ